MPKYGGGCLPLAVRLLHAGLPACCPHLCVVVWSWRAMRGIVLRSGTRAYGTYIFGMTWLAFMIGRKCLRDGSWKVFPSTLMGMNHTRGERSKGSSVDFG